MSHYRTTGWPALIAGAICFTLALAGFLLGLAEVLNIAITAVKGALL